MRWHKHLWMLIFVFVLVLGAGAYAYHHTEGWGVLDSVYFVVVTVTTIGYGDLVPVTTVGKIFTMFFSFFGIAFAFYMLSLISTRIFKRHLGRKVSEIKHETVEQEEVKEQIKKARKRKRKK